MVKVVENKVPEKVLCTAEAYPEASFMWRFNDEIIQTQVRYLGLLDSIKDVDGSWMFPEDLWYFDKSNDCHSFSPGPYILYLVYFILYLIFWQVIHSLQNLLNFGSAVTRDQAGVYMCEAQNRHGQLTFIYRYNADCDDFDDNWIMMTMTRQTSTCRKHKLTYTMYIIMHRQFKFYSKKSSNKWMSLKVTKNPKRKNFLIQYLILPCCPFSQDQGLHTNTQMT